MSVRILIVVIAAFSFAGCEKQMQNMYEQPRNDPLERNALFEDEGASRTLPKDIATFSRGSFAGTSSGRIGRENAARWERDRQAQQNPYPITMALLQRGRERFEIYCTPCHSPLGDGDGFVVRRGFPAPPSYHIDRLRQAPDRHFFDVMTDGYGIMYSYADRVSPPDRWAIIAYIRALQLSRHAPLDSLSDRDRAQLGPAP